MPADKADQHRVSTGILPECWQSLVTGQVFRAYDRWQKHEVELVDWQTSCRECGGGHCFTMRADHPDSIAVEIAVRWHGVCQPCRRSLREKGKPMPPGWWRDYTPHPDHDGGKAA